MDRRTFLQTSAGIAGAAGLPLSRTLMASTAPAELAIVRGGEPAAMVKQALEAMGGISRFISRGDKVVLKPNMSWDRSPQQAVNTNPEVVAEVVRLCLEAGAREVRIFDNTLNEPRRCYKRSGIQEAAEEAGARVEFIFERKFKKVAFDEGELIRSWEIYQDVLDCDKLINIPIAKHHSISGVSLSMKNLMGVIGGNRGQFHRDFDTKIVDLSTRVKPDLIILDAYRMLLRNGPTGGSLADVATPKTIAAGTDPVAIDGFGISLFEKNPVEIGYLVKARERGLGDWDLSGKNVRNLSIAG